MTELVRIAQSSREEVTLVALKSPAAVWWDIGFPRLISDS